VIFGATTLVHQFVRIGALAFTGMGSFISQDVPPYVMVAGHMASPYGINSEGLRRRGFAPPTIQAIKRAYRTLYRSGLSLEDAKRQLESQAQGCHEIRLILEFLAISKRGIAR
jgi:UDP-N-acetylglucosamine acyltransferase